MKTLRKAIRQIILEGAVKDAFEEAWYNTEEERQEFQGDPDVSGTLHRDQLSQVYSSVDFVTDDDIDQLFEDKRDLKRLWNEVIDANGLRDFWEGPKMKYFHSLSYYGSPLKGTDKIKTGQTNDHALQDLTAHGFFQMYDKTGNRDEMSTYGIYNGSHNIPRYQRKFGVIISGRVTLATSDDAFTESRSKASSKDISMHTSSGMPKRIMPTDAMVSTLLFEEEEIIAHPGDLGECIIDNWSIEAIVCARGHQIFPEAEKLAKQYGVPLLTSQEIFR